MFRGIVERIRVIELGLAFREIARDHECRAEQGMPEHERDCRSMLLRQRQALRRKLTHSIGLKRHKVRHPKTEEGPKTEPMGPRQIRPVPRRVLRLASK